MSLLANLLTPAIGAAGNPNDERWWTPDLGSPVASSGVRVTADLALKASAVWACSRIIAETLAALPLLTYRRLGDGGREAAPDHPLYQTLHRQPNAEQTALEWVEFETMHAVMRGTGYSRKRPGPRGPADQLEPIHPARVRVETLTNGRPRYQVADPQTGREAPVLREDMFVLRGLSLDGLTGVSVIEYARESIGLALGAEGFGSRFFANDARPGGALKVRGKLSDTAARRLQSTWNVGHGGFRNAHRVAIFEDGIEWQQTGMSNEDAQFLATREFQIADIARWFRVPLHMIGETSRTTSWGSGIEQLSIGFVIYTLLPWLKRWEQAVARDLLLAPDRYFVEFLVTGLLRGDTKARYEAYAIGRQWGWLSRNDVRRLENMNPIADGDDYLSPLNMTPGGRTPPAEGRALLGEHYRLLLTDTAARVVRKELAAMGRAARRHEGDADGWRAAVRDFYAEHAAYVAETLHLSRREAAWYAGRQEAALLADGPAAMADWEARCAAELVALVTDGEEEAA